MLPLAEWSGPEIEYAKIAIWPGIMSSNESILMISSYGSDEKIKNKKSQEFSVKDD